MSYLAPAFARPPGSLPRRALIVCLALLLAIASAVGLTQPARAATPGITSNILLNGATYDGTSVVDEGDTLTLRVQYSDDVTPGSTVVFEFGDNVTLTGIPASNTAVQSFVQDGNKVSITFKDPWPANVNQGVFDLEFKVDAVDASAQDRLTWKVDGDEHSIDVIIRNQGDQFANVSEGYAKSATPGNLDSFVTVVGGEVKLKPEIVDQQLSYTLRLDSPEARSGYPVADQLPAGLGYVTGSFAGQLTSWDADGLNRTTGPFAFTPTVAGGSFTGSVDVPGPSILTITYQAEVTDVAALEALLQARYDALGGATGSFEIQLTNTATFGTTDRTASVRLRGNVPGVNIGQAFTKTADWSTRNVVTDADGNLTPPADITYMLKADLRQWTGGPNFTLDRNVVISDDLPAQATWNTTAADFVTASGITLTQAATCPADAAAFAGDVFVGQYCVSGQRLLINVGKDNTTNASIAVKAQLTTVAGLEQTGTTTVEDATPYRLRNVAAFHYRDGAPYNAQRDVTVVTLPDSSGGINDSSVFTKSGQAEDTTIDPGETVTVDYTFKVAAGKGIDARTSTIVDYVDTDVFDLDDPSSVAVSGTYDGQALTASHFDLGTDADGNLVIELSSTGKAVVDARGADKAYEVRISLTTTPFVGKETRTITNKATLFGSDGDPLYWSETEAEATSYGDEAEVRKRVFDRSSQEWVETLEARMDGHGNLVQDTYVYRIEFIPRGSYDNVAIIPVDDVLPNAAEFLGFVTEADAATGANPTGGPVDIGGNLEATHDAASGTVTIEQKSGTLLDAGAPIAAYVAVRITDASAPVVNRIGSTFAEIVPLKSVSVGDYVWVDTDRDGRQNPGEPGIPGVVLTIVGPDGGPVTDVDGNPVGPVTTGPNGEYTFDNLPALSGNETYTVRIDREASAGPLKPYVPTRPGQGDRPGDSSTWEASTEPGDLHDDGDRDPTLDFGFVSKTYAIGDVVWIDADKDGVQDVGEAPLSGVKVELLRDGKVIATTTTDVHGRYVFDNLPAGTYQVRFTLTDEQKETYEFTTRDSGSGDAADSDANPADGLTTTIVLDDSNPALTGSYGYREIGATQGIDPTWDAGVVVKDVAKTYAIGDVVWIDADKDGVQDKGEKPLSGVKVDLLRDGKVIATTTTDAHGRYVFDNLPAGTYQVRFTLTDKQRKKYEFTTRDSRSDDARDSDANRSDGLTRTIVLDDSNPALTRSYDHRKIGATQGIDPTWDAGVILTEAVGGDGDSADDPADDPAGDAADDAASGEPDEQPTGYLPNTGTTIGLGIVAAMLALLGAGGSLLLIGRRRKGDPMSEVL
ncbi:carboxypeptidase regulatory-like domain-containing protein [Nocardioides sp. LMS-CY]|uniref:SdrD B-like domain-containing protein n=1 Tax=Nocardioides sp. (strain LMS-CY) TaxID=2840457 RepID=UPI001C0083C0|nr:SdrD B-like domain-containing protein [Nocardioides sp. LMS-CY]QWF23199.1 carboxypeptidase regulatory-like domain-containing protein [Nocardioides sp. LMS-CY]